MREWEMFRRHLVHLHYDELAQWLVEAGIPRERIWSSQGLMAPLGEAMPFAIDLDSPPRNYDSGGMSIAGAKPALGHLGVILYGEAAVNDVRMENGQSLFATLAALDPRWAVVEYNTADLRNPQVPPSYRAAYRGLRDMWNFGARYVSPMAWNGSNGVIAGKPGYSTFTAWRNTPLEDRGEATSCSRAPDCRSGALLWTFGTPRTPTATAGRPTRDVRTRSRLRCTSVRTPTTASHSSRRKDCRRRCSAPGDSCWASTGHRRACGGSASRRARSAGGGWQTLADASGAALRVRPTRRSR